MPIVQFFKLHHKNVCLQNPKYVHPTSQQHHFLSKKCELTEKMLNKGDGVQTLEVISSSYNSLVQKNIPKIRRINHSLTDRILVHTPSDLHLRKWMLRN